MRALINSTAVMLTRDQPDTCTYNRNKSRRWREPVHDANFNLRDDSADLGSGGLHAGLVGTGDGDCAVLLGLRTSTQSC